MELGWVGLGVMGGRAAKRLLDAGHQVAGYNRTASKADWLVEQGLTLKASPREVAAAADVVFTMVTNSASLEQVLQGPDGVFAGLRPGAVVVDFSTVSPRVSTRLAAEADALGARMIESPVSGSHITLEAGELSVMTAGDEATCRQVEPILLDIGRKVTYMGDHGQALLMKIAINLQLLVQFTAYAEGLLLAEKGGIPRATAVEAMFNSVIASPLIKYRGPNVLPGQLPQPAWFDMQMMQKDMLLALELGRELDVPMPTTAATNELLTAARGMGLGDDDFSAVFYVLGQMAGLAGPGEERRQG